MKCIPDGLLLGMDRFEGLKNTRVLVLGFYDRGNAGDELYKACFARLFGPRVACVCLDDVDDKLVDLAGFDAIVCGGGDVVNAYFMKKLRRVLLRTQAPCYAVSVGIPFASCAEHLDLFDHAFVRSESDRAVAEARVGADNVTCIPDLVFSLQASIQPPKGRTSPNKIDLGVCLAQPMFANARIDALVEAFADACCEALESAPGLHLHFFAFNMNRANPLECDVLLNECMVLTLHARKESYKDRVRICQHVDPKDPADAARRLGAMDALLCSRYHSVVLAAMLGVPCVAMYCSQKVDNLLRDLRSNKSQPPPIEALRLAVDSAYAPAEIPSRELAAKIRRILNDKRCHKKRAYAPAPPDRVLRAYQSALAEVVLSRKRKVVAAHVIPDAALRCTFGAGRAMALLANYLGPFGDLRRAISDGARDEIARLLCYGATGCLGSAYAWGLGERLRDSNPDDLERAVRWIADDWQERLAAASSADRGIVLHTGHYLGPRTPMITFGEFDQFSDFQGAHRSGWAYVLKGLRAFDASLHARRPALFMDSYVDRTFHWGRVPLALDGQLPRRVPWIGFVHHTFDEAHSSHNCAKLFEEPLFLQSLESLRCLITLSSDLAARLRQALRQVGASHVQVHALVHPTEIPEKGFTMQRFADNPKRRVVQIGAWLRDPYAIYELPLTSWNNPLRLTKTALKGKDMHAYFKPVTKDAADGGDAIREGGCCRPGPRDGNQYLAAVDRMLQRNADSVEILERLEDEAYDDLLACNLVFLRLVDAAAVNTALECVARNTPLLVNRLPALEELLGAGYPGFYDDLAHAAHLLGSRSKIYAMHGYLKNRVDKTKISLESFLTGFGAILDQVSI